MAYLGRRGALAPLTSADIPVGIVEGTDVAFLENASATQNLAGTYSTERMYLNDSYTLTGDVTVTGHLALGSIADEDIVITQDGTERTITGSGTLDAGNVLQDTHRTSLTDMTGELGSAVTGSPALALTNTTGVLPLAVTGGAGLNTLPNTSNISKWTVTAFTASGTTYITGWSGTTINLTEASIPTVSSTVFTFPTTGFWEITGKQSFAIASSTALSIENITIALELSTDSGSTYTTVGGAFGSFYCPANDWFREQPNFQDIIDVQNVSTYRVRFRTYVWGSTGLYQYQGGGTNGETTFRKLGET